MPDAPLTPDQQREAERFAALFLRVARREARRFGQLLAARPDAQLLGRTEFDLRTPVHRLGAAALEAALEGREKSDCVPREAEIATGSPTSDRHG